MSQSLLFNAITERYCKHVNPGAENVEIKDYEHGDHKYNVTYRIFSEGIETHLFTIRSYYHGQIIRGFVTPKIGSSFFQKI